MSADIDFCHPDRPVRPDHMIVVQADVNPHYFGQAMVWLNGVPVAFFANGTGRLHRYNIEEKDRIRLPGIDFDDQGRIKIDDNDNPGATSNG
jgi:ABC-type oligopeptide transport system substrate-binding subunit